MELKDIKYYKPIYCYRHFPSTIDIYEAIITDLSRHDKKITLYESFEKAVEVGKDMLCDDDTYDIAVFDYTHGFLHLSYIGSEKVNIIACLTRWSECYNVADGSWE